MKIFVSALVLGAIADTTASAAFCGAPFITTSSSLRQGSCRRRHVGPELVTTTTTTTTPWTTVSHSSIGLASSRSDGIDNNKDDTIDLYRRQHGYQLARDAPGLNKNCPLTELQIHKTIAARRNYQKSREYEKADQLLAVLNKAEVYLHDKRREWRADGLKSFGLVPYQRRGAVVVVTGDAAETADFSEEEYLSKIATVVATRDRAKKERNFIRADQLESQLMVMYNVQVDDKRREWSFVVDDDTDDATAALYVPTPLASSDSPTHTIDATTQSQIQQLLTERAMARKSKDFDRADAILVELQKDYSIAVDDRTKEWKIISDWENNDGSSSSDPFVVGSKGSQRSAFMNKHGEQQQQQQQTQGGKAQKEVDSAVITLMDEESDQSTATEEEDSFFADLDIAASAKEEENDDDDDDESSMDEDLPSAKDIDTIDISTSLPEVSHDDEEHDDEEVEEEVASVAQDDETDDEEALSKLTVIVLKDKLRSAGLPVSGRKADLIDRLLSV